MTTNLMTMEEMLADLSTSSEPEATINLPANSNPAKDRFLLTQFQLLSTPYFVIYLQGKKGAVLGNLSDNLDSQSLLEYAFKEAIFRRVGRNVPLSITNLLPSIEANKHKFYTDKEWHKAILTSLMEAHSLPIAKETTATRAYPLAAIESYLDALASYLIENNYSRIEDWLENITTLDLNAPNVWDDL